MKWLLTPVLYFLFLSTNAQYIYVYSEEPFQVLTSAKTKPQTSVWIEIKDLHHPVVFKLKNGKLLRRFFTTATQGSIFLITEESIRLRPNMAIFTADTIFQPIIKPLPQRDISNMVGTIAQVEALPYEYEKLEAVQRALEKPDLECRDIIDLMNCLKYDAQKVTVINGLNTIPPGCMAELKTNISEAYQTLLKE